MEGKKWTGVRVARQSCGPRAASAPRRLNLNAFPTHSYTPPNRMLAGGVTVKTILSLRAVVDTNRVPTTGWLECQNGGPLLSLISCLSVHA